jgi:Transposase DDE domain.
LLYLTVLKPSDNEKYSALIFTSLATLMQEESFKERHRRFSRYFTRKRVLSFVDLLVLQINRLVLSLSVELSTFLDVIGSPAIVSKQAFSQARQNLSHTAFIELQDEFVKGYYTRKNLVKLYEDKYLLLGVDGSKVQLPNCDELANHFGYSKNNSSKGMVMGRLSVVYDLVNEIILGGKFTSLSIGERRHFFDLYQRFKVLGLLHDFKPLYLMDRGYPSFELCKRLDLDGAAFVIRCKASFCKETKAFVASGQAEQRLYLSPRSWHKGGKAKESPYAQGLELRIVRVLLKSGEYKYLLTNTDLSIEQLSELYQLRWGVETLYSFLKEKMQLENFSSKTTEGVLQDCYASLLTANLSQILIQEAQEELDQEQALKKNKHTKLDFGLL